MTNFENRHFIPEIEDCAARAFKKKLYNGRVVQNGAWLSNFEIELLGYVLKRKLLVLSNRGTIPEPLTFCPESKGITDGYPET
jgi:hypothetical protein